MAIEAQEIEDLIREDGWRAIGTHADHVIEVVSLGNIIPRISDRSDEFVGHGQRLHERATPVKEDKGLEVRPDDLPRKPNEISSRSRPLEPSLP